MRRAHSVVWALLLGLQGCAARDLTGLYLPDGGGDGATTEANGDAYPGFALFDGFGGIPHIRPPLPGEDAAEAPDAPEILLPSGLAPADAVSGEAPAANGAQQVAIPADGE